MSTLQHPIEWAIMTNPKDWHIELIGLSPGIVLGNTRAAWEAGIRLFAIVPLVASLPT